MICPITITEGGELVDSPSIGWLFSKGITFQPNGGFTVKKMNGFTISSPGITIK